MKTEVHYRVHKSLPLGSIVSQINPFQSHCMLWPVLCLKPEPFMRHLSFGFFDRTYVNLRIYHLLCTCYVSMSTPDLITLIIFGTKSVNYDESASMFSTRLLLLACIYWDKWRHIHYYVYTEINDVTPLLRIFRDKLPHIYYYVSTDINDVMLLLRIYRDKLPHIYYYVSTEINDVTPLLRIYLDKWLRIQHYVSTDVNDVTPLLRVYRDKWLQSITAYLPR